MQSAVLLELLAARQGSSNPALQEMLARMRGGAMGGGKSPKELLASLAQTNPQLSAIMERINATNSSADVPTLEAEETRAARNRPSARRDYFEDAEEAAFAMTEELRTRSDALATELNVYRERVDQCAAALGACALCWGGDPGCRACRGRGLPGFTLPDELLFEEMVVPAVRMAREYRSK
jgi:hypothetical protein